MFDIYSIFNPWIDKERAKLFEDMLDTSKLLGKEDNPLHRRFYFT